ncbi:MAG: ZIP family metal transporter [Muribaculaceae bacterium]|nr:ZIP family metal transporter [Bacteroides sp.]MDE7496223.1 ZIP family metal transporter [Muribaculaceae bacterium]
MQELFITAAGLGLSSLLGSAIGLIVRRIPHRWNDIFLGFCAGMMLTASIVCLIMPAVESSGLGGIWQVAAGVAAGVLLIGLLDKFTPHLHHLSGIKEEEEHRVSTASLNRTLLFVLAIALHKLPEGLATGISLNGAQDNAFAVALTIALQNIPEGMVVVTPLLMSGVKFLNTTLIAIAIAVLEVVGVFLGFALGEISAILLPFMLSLAGGAMLYVISDEMIPETHSHGFQKAATYALVAGVVTMLVIESAV